MSNGCCPRSDEEVGPGRATGRADGCLQARVPASRMDLDPDGPTMSVVILAMNEARSGLGSRLGYQFFRYHPFRAVVNHALNISPMKALFEGALFGLGLME